MRIVKFAVIGVVALTVFGVVTTGLWNWLVPALFGGPVIGFWQALGLLLLSRILFGGFRGGPGHHPAWRRRMLERWEQMTPEEREKLRAGLRERCHGGADPRGTESPA